LIRDTAGLILWAWKRRTNSDWSFSMSSRTLYLVNEA